MLATTFGRRPRLIVYDNTAGLLRKRWLRAAVELTLTQSDDLFLLFRAAFTYLLRFTLALLVRKP